MKKRKSDEIIQQNGQIKRNQTEKSISSQNQAIKSGFSSFRPSPSDVKKDADQ